MNLSNLEDGQQALSKALAELESVFSKYRGQASWHDELSPHSSDISVHTPVNELSEEDYLDFCCHSLASSELGNAIRYFLPRIANDLSHDQPAPCCDEQLAAVLADAGWQDWDDPERTAIETWLNARLYARACMLIHGAHASDFFQALRMAACCGIEVAAFMHNVKSSGNDDALTLMAATLCEMTNELVGTGWPPGWHDYWDSRNAPVSTTRNLIALLISEPTKELFRKACEQDEEDDQHRFYSNAITCIDVLREAGDAQEKTPLARAYSLID